MYGDSAADLMNVSASPMDVDRRKWSINGMMLSEWTLYIKAEGHSVQSAHLQTAAKQTLCWNGSWSWS